MIDNNNDANDVRAIMEIEDPEERQSALHEEALRYDEYAETFFAPIYPVIAEQAVKRTGIRSGNLLDVGCSGGYLGIEVMKLGDFYGTFCDINPESLKLAAGRLEKNGFRGRTEAGDVQDLPFADGSFDLVVSRGSMPFWDDQEQAFREIHRVLSDGGMAYIGVGYGSAELREQAHAKMREVQGEQARRCNRPANTRMYEENGPYIEILNRLGGPWKIFDRNGEGLWFLFGKTAARDRKR